MEAISLVNDNQEVEWRHRIRFDQIPALIRNNLEQTNAGNYAGEGRGHAGGGRVVTRQQLDNCSKRGNNIENLATQL